MTDERDKIYILDTRDMVGDAALFWRKDACGYTYDLNAAGLFDPDYKLSRSTDVKISQEMAQSCSVVCVNADKLNAALKRLMVPSDSV